jgi:cellulose biosynthesis protein BcsQ
VGTTTIAINAAIALHRELGRKVALVDGNLQFGDHRLPRPGLDARASSTWSLRRRSMPTSFARSWSSTTLASTSCLRRHAGDRRAGPPEHLPVIADQLSSLYDYTLIDIDKRLDDVTSGVFEAAETIFVVMTADLSCLRTSG